MFEFKPGLYSCGVQDAALRVFDIIMHTPHGTSYNAFLLKGSRRNVLLETVKLGFCDEYFRQVEEVVPIAEIDSLIINHTEPDHAGTIPLLLKRNPDMTVIGTSSAIAFVSHIINGPFHSRVVKKGDSLDLGDRELQFFPMPNLHWPDTMFTFDPKTRALFSCDCFGAHYSHPGLLLSRMPDTRAYIEAQTKYFHDILSPFADPFVLRGIECARELQPDVICTGHGPVLDTQVPETLERYAALCEGLPKASRKVAIVYVSAYGYTAALAEAIAAAIREERVEVSLTDAASTPREEVMDRLAVSQGVLLGSPTILGDLLKPIGEITTALYPYMMKGKLASAFGSYGWSGEAVPNIMGRLGQLKARSIEGLRVRMKPGEEDMKKAMEFGKQFAAAL